MQAAAATAWVVEQALALGLDLCGVAAVEGLTELERLPEWLERGYAGEMAYLHDKRRCSPGRVLEGARSLIVCALNYNTSLPYSTHVPWESESPPTDPDATQGQGGPHGWISRYAWGDDYHDVLGRKLEALITALREQFHEPFEARAYVDTGPIVERVAAKHAGLGWLAKNTCLINEQLGSWLFLGVILTTLELEPSLGPAEAPPPDLCGQCRLCIDACPTGAIVEPYVLDARRCISYLTIELRGSIPVELREPMGRMVFGCDICQDVCPWNRKAPVTGVAAFWPRRVERRKENRASDTAPLEARPHPEPAPAGEESLRDDSLFTPALEGLAFLSEAEYREAFRASAIKRAKWRGLVRNASIAIGNCGAPPGTPQHTRSVALLERLAASDDAMIAEHARWALARLRS